MKKLLLGFAAISLLVACSGKTDNSSAPVNQDSVSLNASSDDTVSRDDNATDSPSTVSPVEQSSNEPKVEKKENSGSEYGSLVSQFESAVNKYDSNMRKQKWQEGEKWRTKAYKLYVKIEKIKGKLTPDERKKYDKAYKKYGRLGDMWQ